MTPPVKSIAHKGVAVADLAIPPTGPNALFNNPGVGIRSARRRRRLKAFNWGAHVGETISGGLTRGEGGRFAGSGQPSARGQLSAAQKKRREEMRAKRQARADERVAAYEQEQAQEDATRADEDAYIAAGVTGPERQRRRAEIAAQRRERAAQRRERRRQEAETERLARQQEDEAEAKTREEEQAKAESDKGGKGGGGGGGGKKKPTDEEKKAAAEQKKAENRTKTAPQAGLSTDEAEFLAGAASGTLPNGSFDASHLRELGLVEDTGDTTEATDAGRRLLAALEKGDVRAALAAIQDGKARVKRDQAKRQRDEESAKKKRQREADQASGDGDKSRNRGPTRPGQTEPRSNPPVSTMPVERTDPAAERERNRTLAQQIIRNLEARRRRRRKEATVKAQATFGGKRRADLPDSAFAGPDRSFPIVTAQDVRDAVRSLGRTKHDRAAVKRGIIRRARAIGAMDALPEGWKVEKGVGRTVFGDGTAVATPAVVRASPAPVTSIPPTFTVFKDASGVDRWAAITTTAYQDKDQEWISRKAIRSVVAAGDAGAPRGPLRFWHVPGLDLGDCDYQAALGDGRLLLESGTFRSRAAARIGQEAARRGYQMSPGFVHTRQEPRGGVFDHIALFERSFVPPGRASNPYTRLLTKETRMLTDEKRKEFEQLAGDTEGRALLQSLLAQADTTVKERDREGTVYKDAPPWAQALIARLDALETTVKAPMDPASMMDAGATEADDALAKMDADMGMGDGEPEGDEGMLDDEGFADLIVQKLMAALGPMLDLEKKMTGYLGEMKAMLQPQTAKDDARASEAATYKQATDELLSSVLDLQKRLKSLEGDQPRAARTASMHTQVWEAIAGIPVTKEQAAALATQQANQPPAGLSSPIEIAAHKALWGNS